MRGDKADLSILEVTLNMSILQVGVCYPGRRCDTNPRLDAYNIVNSCERIVVAVDLKSSVQSNAIGVDVNIKVFIVLVYATESSAHKFWMLPVSIMLQASVHESFKSDDLGFVQKRLGHIQTFVRDWCIAWNGDWCKERGMGVY